MNLSGIKFSVFCALVVFQGVEVFSEVSEEMAEILTKDTDSYSSQETRPSEKKADIQFPFQGRVQGEGINVRSGNNVNYESLARLENGTSVVVIGESYDWYKIWPPEGVAFWVHQSLIQDKKVLGDYVNVRSGPSLENSINCQIERGFEVEILEQVGEWAKIKPPPNAQTWIAKQFVVAGTPLAGIRFKKALFCGTVLPDRIK